MLSNVSGTFSWPPKVTIKKLALCRLIWPSKFLCQIEPEKNLLIFSNHFHCIKHLFSFYVIIYN